MLPTEGQGSSINGVAPRVLSGDELLRASRASLRWLEGHAAEINGLNVFPVPDGDTGTNMVLTLRAAVNEAKNLDSPTVAEVSSRLAHGALLGARGNSGVILSQILRGLGDGLAQVASADPSELAGGFARASEVAYEAVANPVEGTILTVARAAGVAAMSCRPGTFDELAEAVVRAAGDSVARTPDQLDVLAEAGVVDAGGRGLLVIYEGLLRTICGVELPEVTSDDRLAETLTEFAVAHQADEHGYCTEFLIHGTELHADTIRSAMDSFGGSLLVVGNPDLVRVHIHTDTPGEVLTEAHRFGSLDGVKADNMDIQQEAHFASIALEGSKLVAPRVPVVSIATGAGMESVFDGFGAFVVHGGSSMNPSTGDIAHGIEAVDGEWAVVLPNNANVVMAARQAAQQSGKDVRVIPTRTVPEGIAALMAFNGTATVDVNEQKMRAAADDATTIGITRAVRGARIGAVTVKQGDYVGLLDDELTAVGGDANELVARMLRCLTDTDLELVTVYYGRTIGRGNVEQLQRDLEAGFQGLEVELISGGQELYVYLVSVE